MNESLQVVALWGAPRSGTTWLGQIFDSHPNVAYRFQPLFSYRFKGAVTPESSPDAVRRFIADLAATDDEFICQSTKRRDGIVPYFEKVEPSHLVFKEVRYLHLAAHFLAVLPSSHAVGIVRHPCAAINSWLKTPREFNPQWDWQIEWERAPSKNLSRSEEYYGFERWKWAAGEFLALARQYPGRFTLVRYDDLVRAAESETARIFERCGLPPSQQTLEFLRASQSKEMEHPDSVFRRPDVADRWRHELAAEIRESILNQCRGTELEQFC